MHFYINILIMWYLTYIPDPTIVLQVDPVELNQTISAYLSSMSASTNPTDQLSCALRLSGILPGSDHEQQQQQQPHQGPLLQQVFGADQGGRQQQPQQLPPPITFDQVSLYCLSSTFLALILNVSIALPYTTGSIRIRACPG